MAEDFVQLPVNGAGSKLRTEKLTIGLNEVHQEVLTLAFANGDLVPGTLADGVLVNLGANNDVTVAGVAILAEQLVQSTSLSVIDDWDEADRAKTNPIVGQAGVQGGSGIITANTQRVVIATDQPPIPVTGAGGGVQYTEGDTDASIVGNAIMWEDAGDTLRPVSAATPLPISAGSLPLPTGAATAANQATEIASLNVLDDWDESDRAKVNPIVGQAGVQGGSGTITALTQRVVIATDQPAIPVTGGGGTQYTEGDTDATITGTAMMWEDAGNTLRPVSAATPLPISAGTLPLPTGAATLAEQQTQSTSLSVIDDWDESDRAKVNPIVGQAGVAGGSGVVGATTQRVTLATDVALPAGTNNIGDVDIASLPNEGQQTMANSISVAIASDQSAVPISAGSLPLPTGAATSANQVTEIASLSIMDDWDNGASDGASVSGDVAHGTADAGEPVKLGLKAINIGANPAAVAADQRTNWYGNRHGIPWILGGHPNIITREITILDADGAQINASLLGAIAAGTAVCITMIDVMASGDNLVSVKCRIGFGAASVPAAALAGVNGVVLSHSKIVPGGGVVKGSGAGVIAQGASDEELRITCDDPAGGAITVTVSYFTISI